MTMELPICMSEEFWMNSQLSVARHYGRVSSGGKVWYVVNSRGMDLFACSMEAVRLGREKAIPAGEPADLVRKDFLKYYRKLGREKFLEVLRFYGPHNDDDRLKDYMEFAVDDGRKESDVELNLVFDEEAL
ncbi:MAG: hypothetical protein VZR06_11855 [Butyrivibrio sp.]|nr:hypothetical protein [Butyrivibrio sp.]